MAKPVYFKYVTAGRAEQIIRNRTIRFTQPDSFNDAFELLPTLDIEKIKETFLKESNNLKGLDDFTMGIAKIIYDTYSSIGILCLSSRFDIPLMWGHYTGDYSGVVIGFDIDCFISCESTFDRQDIKSGPVKYSEYRCRFPKSNDLTDPIFHKDKVWEYENEWRIIRPLDTLINVANGIYVADFPPSAIRSVIFGTRTTLNDKLKILDALRSQECSHVGRYISYLNDKTFEIEIDYLSSTFGDESEMVYYPDELLLRRFRDKLISRGELYRAMEVLEKDTEFVRLKDVINLHNI